MKAAFVLIKFLEGKKNQIYFLLGKKKKTSHLRVLSVQWSCQTTSQLSPGLTSSEFSDPLGAEAQVGPTVGGHWVMSMLSPPYVPWAFPSGSLRVSKSQNPVNHWTRKMAFHAGSVHGGRTHREVIPVPATLTLLACTHQPLSVHMEVFPLKPCQSTSPDWGAHPFHGPPNLQPGVPAQLTPQAAGADATPSEALSPQNAPTLVGECVTTGAEKDTG